MTVVDIAAGCITVVALTVCAWPRLSIVLMCIYDSSVYYCDLSCV